MEKDREYILHDDLITLIGGAKSEKDFLVLGNSRVRLVQTNYYEGLLVPSSV